MKGVAVSGNRGGLGKTIISNAIGIGAAFSGVGAHVIHTDNREPIIQNGRPYKFYDGRNIETLVKIARTAATRDGLLIIDGGGNRPEFDEWISKYVDLIIIPVTPDWESVALALEALKKFPTAKLLKNKVVSGKAQKEKHERLYFSKLPQESILGNIPKCDAVDELSLSDDQKEGGVFKTPDTKVNNICRSLYRMVRQELFEIDSKPLLEETKVIESTLA